MIIVTSQFSSDFAANVASAADVTWTNNFLLRQLIGSISLGQFGPIFAESSKRGDLTIA